MTTIYGLEKHSSACSLPEFFFQNFKCNYLQANINEVENFAKNGKGVFFFQKNSCDFPVFMSVHSPLENAYIIENVHGNDVVPVSFFHQKADGHYVALSKLAQSPPLPCSLAIKTADCLPVLMFYEDSDYFFGAIVHAGWRGLSSQIISRAIFLLAEKAGFKGISQEVFLSGLNIVLAPAIFGTSYECGIDVFDAIQKHIQVLFSLSKNRERSSVSYELKQKISELFSIASDVSCDRYLKEKIQFNSSFYGWRLQSGSCFPDLQLLAFCECVLAGLPEQNFRLVRFDTYTNSFLPSYRASSHGSKQTVSREQRLWTHLSVPWSSCSEQEKS